MTFNANVVNAVKNAASNIASKQALNIAKASSLLILSAGLLFTNAVAQQNLASPQTPSNLTSQAKNAEYDAKFSILESSRSSVVIYELVNIRFSANMIDSRDYLQGFTPILNQQSSSKIAQRRLPVHTSSQERLTSQQLNSYSNIELMLTGDETISLHERALKSTIALQNKFEKSQVLALTY
jgi:hypothetical protein